MASETIDRLTQQFRTNRMRFEAFCRVAFATKSSSGRCLTAPTG